MKGYLKMNLRIEGDWVIESYQFHNYKAEFWTKKEWYNKLILI